MTVMLLAIAAVASILISSAMLLAVYTVVKKLLK